MQKTNVDSLLSAWKKTERNDMKKKYQTKDNSLLHAVIFFMMHAKTVKTAMD